MTDYFTDDFLKAFFGENLLNLELLLLLLSSLFLLSYLTLNCVSFNLVPEQGGEPILLNSLITLLNLFPSFPVINLVITFQDY